jgi:DNA-binding response OmpR family regulator
MKIVHSDSGPSAYGTPVLDGAGHILRLNGATVNFTSTEAKILSALVRSGTFGLCVIDISALLGYDVSNRSIQLVRAHISNIRKKILLIGDDRISLINGRYAITSSIN